MSDLYCPVTLVCAFPAEDREQAQALADALLSRRIAAVFSSDASPAVRTAQIVAASLGVAASACPSLRRAELEEIADQHRGETVLVVGDRTALETVVPALVRNVTPAWAEDRALGDTETVEIEGDADGWVLRRWGSERLEPAD